MWHLFVWGYSCCYIYLDWAFPAFWLFTVIFTVICIKMYQFVSQQCWELAWPCWVLFTTSLPERELAFKPECTNTEPRNQSSLWNNFLRISQRGSGRPRIPAYSLNPRLLWQHFTRSLFIYLFFQWANWGMECPAGLFLLLGQALVPQLALGCSAGLGLAQPLSLSPSE